jgi:hypothetical protein
MEWSRLLMALFTYALLAVGATALAHRALRAVAHVAVSEWILLHMGLPLLRVALLLAFILMAYPALYGTDGFPTLGQVLSREPGRLSDLVNGAFLIALLLPWVPWIGRIQALVLPAQGITASALLFHWASRDAALGSVDLWPGIGTLLGIALAAFLGHLLALRLAVWVRDWGRTALHVDDLDEAGYQAMILILQAPAILLYSLSLGAPAGSG